MQKHRKVAYAGAESPLKRLCATPKKNAEKKIKMDTALKQVARGKVKRE